MPAKLFSSKKNGSIFEVLTTDFNVKVNRLGMFQLQHAQSRKYVCFNRRKRVTVRLLYRNALAATSLALGFITTPYQQRIDGML
ncbi:hypothetical protein ANCDUO_16636 [Ancylostoma duodenale]|uniref:Uncharacterized protein n=1 Tax=Ancylostoma duodenale TaxID=51022 RepID=A0A0C2CTY0_9BILA|nr:hypothetical protein ANCDUO_16636 [Ancylostoma duodenale]